jgi:hypothetical protein
MTINDSEWRFLRTVTNTTGTFNDMYARYLRGLGYTGTLQDMLRRWKKSGGVLSTTDVALSSDDGSVLLSDDGQIVEVY